MADETIQFFHNFAVAEIAKLGTTAVLGVSFIYVAAAKVDLYETNIAELAKYVKENNPGCLEYRWKKLPLEGDTQTYVWFEKFVDIKAFDAHIYSPKFKEIAVIYSAEAVFSKPPEMHFLPDENVHGSFSR